MDLLNESQIVTGFISEILKTAYQGIRDKVKGEVKEHDFFGTTAKKYGQKIADRYNFIRVFGMSEPMPLRNLYVRTNILEKVSYYKKVSLEELENAFNQDKRSFGKTKETRSGIEVLNELQRYIVLGKPGAGKTTYLKYLALRSIDKEADIKDRKIPIFITLKELSDKQISLVEYITEQFDISGLPEAEPFIEQILKNGKCLLLLDGLDEVDEERKSIIIQEIIDYSDKYDGNQFVISCRIAAYNHWFQRFHDMEMADFNEGQIEQFVINWFTAKGEPETGMECFEKMKGNKSLLDMASTPLLLILLCIAFDENYDFQTNRAELYREAIQALLKKWDSTRRIKRKEIYRNLTPNRKEQLFSIIAMATFSRGQYFIPELEILDFIQKYIFHLPGAEEDSISIDAEDVLREMIAQHGIIIPRAKRVYSFAHLTFQEYFTAKFIVENRDTGTLKNLVAEYFGDKKWREVFLLTASMLPHADAFFILMQEDIDRTIEEDKKLMDILEMVERMVAKSSVHPISVRRSYGLFLILAHALDFNYVLNHARARDLALKLAFELALALDRPLALDLEGLRTRDLVRNLARDLAYVLDLDLDRELEHVLESDLDRDRELDIDIHIYIYNTPPLSPSLLNKYHQFLACLTTENYASRELKEKLIDEILALPKE